MKKIIITSVALICIFLAGCKNDVNFNRYGSMEVANSVLFFYANGSVYQYNNGTISEYEKADSIFFEVDETDNGLEIIYNQQAKKREVTPYDEYLDGITQIAYDDEYVYARWPQGKSFIQVYKIVKDSNGDVVELKEEVKITY